MVFTQSRTNASDYGDLTLGGAELPEVKSLRILEITLDSKLTRETHLCELCRRQPEVWVSCSQQEGVFIVHVCSRAVSMYMFCPAWSIVPPCE